MWLQGVENILFILAKVESFCFKYVQAHCLSLQVCKPDFCFCHVYKFLKYLDEINQNYFLPLLSKFIHNNPAVIEFVS
jgi:hypothetical protein